MGFYPDVATRTLRRALGGQEPLVTLCQIDAAFEQGTMFRHLTIVSLTEQTLIHIHIDEYDGERATVATAIHSVESIRAVSMLEVIESPENDGSISEITVSVNLGGVRRLDMEPARCEDPECTAEHGFTASSIPDDLTLRISVTADGEELFHEAQEFVKHLTCLIAKRTS